MENMWKNVPERPAECLQQHLHLRSDGKILRGGTVIDVLQARGRIKICIVDSKTG